MAIPTDTKIVSKAIGFYTSMTYECGIITLVLISRDDSKDVNGNRTRERGFCGDGGSGVLLFRPNKGNENEE